MQARTDLYWFRELQYSHDKRTLAPGLKQFTNKNQLIFTTQKTYVVPILACLFSFGKPPGGEYVMFIDAYVLLSLLSACCYTALMPG